MAGNGPRQVVYVGQDLWELELAWATTVHKAQGSESQAVIVVLSPAHKPLLTRRLLYTGAPRLPSCASSRRTLKRFETLVLTTMGLAMLS